MKKTTTDKLLAGGAMMAVGAAAALATGAMNKGSNPKKSIKKFAKKSAKTVDGIMGNMQYMFK